MAASERSRLSDTVVEYPFAPNPSNIFFSRAKATIQTIIWFPFNLPYFFGALRERPESVDLCLVAMESFLDASKVSILLNSRKMETRAQARGDTSTR